MFIDANIFIHAYEDGGRKKANCLSLLGRIRRGEMRAQTSTLVLNEVLYYFQEDGEDIALRVFVNLCQMPNLQILGVEPACLARVPEFVRQGMAATDAYHAAVMKCNGIDTICSYDKG
ncbi:MAG: type II toxin-antitoxin system VapC family toxin, partial [Candidatus Micrarchaeota archaeon]